MAQRRAKDTEEKEEARRHKKAQPVYDQQKQAAEAEDSQARQVLARVTAEQVSLAKNPQVQGSQRAETVLELQQSYGNRYAQRVMGKVQAKLIVNPLDDQYEKEADRIAAAITQVPDSQLGCGDEKEEPLQTKAVGSQATEVSEGLEASITAARGRGQPLPDSVRSYLEPQLGQDFSQVHIHTDAKANKLSQQLGAKAFTTANDVFFREGAYQPGSDSGRGLIAHELTHVVQQGATCVSRQAAETEQAAAESKEEVQKELKDAVDKLKTKPDPEYIKDLLRVTAECQAQGMGESSYKWAMEEAAEAASTILKKKTAAADVTPEQQEKMIKELLTAAVDAMKLGGDDKAVESALKKARDLAEAQLTVATKNLKPGSTKAKAREVAAKAAQVQLLGGDATEAVEAVQKWEEEPGKEGVKKQSQAR